MLPLRDINKSKKIPFANYLIIFINIFIFFIQLNSYNFEEFIFKYGFIPSKFNFLNLESYKYIIYSMFIHGSLFHIISNLWF
ncbi:MAG: rhomboid family intramembrane serine protease, partial [Patescibacteria group bacterium]|nr:rhomboid family intramembrane serine protease [Patescibacteria group bacterium]